MTSAGVVAIYRELLLPYSETFICEQAGALTRYQPLYVGVRQVAGALSSSPVEQVLLATGRRDLSALRWHGLGSASRTALAMIVARQPRLLHAHFGRDALRGVTLARLLGIPAVATFHGYDVTVLPRWGWGSLKRAVAWRVYRSRLRRLLATGITCIAVSHYIRAQLLALGAAPSAVHVRYIGIDVERFCDPLRHQLEHRELRVLFVGRLVHKKGCLDLLCAAAIIERSFAISLTIIGDGPLRAQLEAVAAATLTRTRFLGAQPPQRIKDELSRTRVFCVPSRTAEDGDAEGFGMVFLEAQAMGVPVVSCRSGGIAEAVEDGVTGDLVREGDVVGLAQALTRLLTDDERWRAMSVRGRSRTVEQFNLRTCTEQLERLYDTLLTPLAAETSLAVPCA